MAIKPALPMDSCPVAMGQYTLSASRMLIPRAEKRSRIITAHDQILSFSAWIIPRIPWGRMTGRETAPHTPRNPWPALRSRPRSTPRDSDKHAPDDGPRKFPMPPTIMAAIPLIPGSIPIKGETMEKLSPKRMPLAPASAPETKKVMEMIRLESTPKMPAVSIFSATARMPRPILVRWMKRSNPTINSTAARR